MHAFAQMLSAHICIFSQLHRSNKFKFYYSMVSTGVLISYRDSLCKGFLYDQSNVLSEDQPAVSRISVMTIDAVFAFDAAAALVL